MKKMTKEDFITKSNTKHNYKYDYSMVDYKNNRTKVNIICKAHGIFSQIPDSHMRGFGCKKCSNNHNYTPSEFKEKLYLLFGDKYNYDKTFYKTQKEKVIISCKYHGDIEKYPISLLRGSGCGKCETKNYKIDTDEFINRSINIHGNLFNYKYVKYINDYTHVKIECKKHGIFEQIPNTHLAGGGCQICSGRYKYTNEIFIDKSNKIHENKYDYSHVNYINAHKKVKILCKKHGFFKQKPYSHLNGRGCPSCKESKGENKINEILLSFNVKFIRQKTFKDCKFKSLLHFDFYIEDLNLCIEYDGEFHFRPVFGKEQFLISKNRDEVKNTYCEENNIKLLRIPYYEYDNIEEIIKSYLNIK